VWRATSNGVAGRVPMLVVALVGGLVGRYVITRDLGDLR